MLVSDRTYEEVYQYLLWVGYAEQIHANREWGNVLDMHGIALARDGFSTTPVERPANLPLQVVLYHFLKRPLHERLLLLSELELLRRAPPQVRRD
jgi:hypothetical protein